MRLLTGLTIVISCIFMQSNALAAIDLGDIGSGLDKLCMSKTCTGQEQIGSIRVDIGCTGTTTKSCYKHSANTVGVAYESCTACKSGYKLTTIQGDCGNGTLNYQTCCVECTDQSDDELVWEMATSGIQIKPAYQQATKQTCTCTGKTTTTVYRCAAGYYGKAIMGTDGQLSGCSACPNDFNSTSDLILNRMSGESTAGNNQLITKCYVSIGNDDSGNYSYETPCYYTDKISLDPIIKGEL